MESRFLIKFGRDVLVILRLVMLILAKHGKSLVGKWRIILTRSVKIVRDGRRIIPMDMKNRLRREVVRLDKIIVKIKLKNVLTPVLSSDILVQVSTELFEMFKQFCKIANNFIIFLFSTLEKKL